MKLIKKIEGGGPKHKLIEGDNLDVMDTLYKKGAKYDIIYMDPPYNTKRGDLGYGDGKKEWSVFIKERMLAAKRLMKKNSLIMVSINNKELHTLKCIMNEVFGESNFKTMLLWRTAASYNSASFVQNTYEYILVYGYGNPEYNRPEPNTKKNYSKNDNDGRGPYVIRKLEKRRNKTGKTYTIDGKQYRPRPGYGWRWSEENAQKGFENNQVVDIDGELYFKTYWNYDRHLNKIERTQPFDQLIPDSVGMTEEGTKAVDSIIGDRDNTLLHPKPISLMKYLFNMIKGDIEILDPFAGSATGLAAVLELNKEDGGGRRIDSININEDNNFYDITLKRAEAVLNGYTCKQKGHYVKGVDGQLEVLKDD